MNVCKLCLTIVYYYHLYNLSVSRRNKALCVEKPIIYETCNPQVRIVKPLHSQNELERPKNSSS